MGADIDAAGRLVENENARAGHQRSRQHDLLLVAARQLANRFVRVGRRDAEGLDHFLRQPLLLTVREAAQPAALGLQPKDDVLTHAELGEYALRLAVFRAKRHPMAQRLPRRVRRDPRAADFDASGIGPNGAEDELGDFCPPRSEEPSEPHDLAGPERQVERSHDAPPPKPLRQKDRLTLGAVGQSFEPLLGLLEFASEHQRNQLEPRKLGGRAFADEAAVAQHRYPIGDLVDLVQEVGDEDDRDAAAFQVADDLEQELGLVGVEAGGRLVQHQHPRVVLERARDGDQLLDGKRKGAERPLDIDVDPEPLEPLPGEAARRAPGDQPEPARLTAERQIPGHRHGRDQIDLLIDCPDAQRARFARRIDLDRAAVDADFALVASDRAGHDLDEGGFAGPVLAHQRVHFAGLDAEIDAIERPDARKRL